MTGFWGTPQAQRQAQARFGRVEAEARRLRTEHAAGRLSDAELRAGPQRLMVQDAPGSWWMVGESGRWYRHDDTGWVAAAPAMAALRPPVTIERPRRHHPVRAFVTLVIMVAITYVGVVIADTLAQGTVAGLATGVIGLLLALAMTVVAWRGS